LSGEPRHADKESEQMSYNLPCDWKSGILMDLTKKTRLGYLVWFQGLGMSEYLRQDIQVLTPFKNPTAYKGIPIDPTTGKTSCTGIIGSFSWNGGVSDPLCIGAYISQQNAQTIRAMMTSTLKTTAVGKLAWWICNFSLEHNMWYEETWPANPLIVTGQLNAPGGSVRLSVGQDLTQVATNINANFYSIYFEVVPAANGIFSLAFANSPKANALLNWGLPVGTGAPSAIA
jgi:hypothetical protein